VEEKIKLPDFDEWIKNHTPPKIKYQAAFDIETGIVKLVGPDFSIDNKKYKHTIDLEEETAKAILNGEINISNCYVDATNGKLEITEVKNLFKIDDVLHRVISKQWTEEKNHDIYITFDKKLKEIKIELSEELGGTKKENKNFVKRKLFWDGDTILTFLITNYNDPHITHNILEAKVSDLQKNPKVFSNVDCPEQFSVYTRRLFKKYVIEEK